MNLFKEIKKKTASLREKQSKTIFLNVDRKEVLNLFLRHVTNRDKD